MTALAHPTVAQLRGIDLFDDCSDEDLIPWAEVATLHEAAPGERIREYGEDLAAPVFLIEGRLEMLVPDGEVEAKQGDQVGPTWIGAIPALLGTRSIVTLRADSDVLYATIDAEEFVDLTLTSKPVFRRAMAQMKPVIGRVSARQQQHDRLESLGTMAAGLAHELNNPASAARRTASDLADALVVLAKAIGMFVEGGVERHDAGRLVALQNEALARCAALAAGAGGTVSMSSLDAADREDAIGEALSDLGVGDAWTLNAPLANAGLDEDYLRRVADTAGEITDPVMHWIAASLSARQLAAELVASTDQMGQLVMAIKKYAYMDRGEVVEVDLREGLDTTLTILKHKLKRTTIEVRRDYDPALGKVLVYGGELNQVWTNLLDNAIDALGESGTITITTRADGDCAEVDIADDGPGMDAQVMRRVFDPFFTTKDVGKGTGLGLDTARRIVVDRHHGSLTVDSSTTAPTGTTFHVRIPVNATQR
jgi:signal transduction histidine kinase